MHSLEIPLPEGSGKEEEKTENDPIESRGGRRYVSEFYTDSGKADKKCTNEDGS